MPIKTNIKDLRPSRLRLSKEIILLSHGYSFPTAFPGGKITVYPWDVDVDKWVTERAAKGTKNFMWDLLKRVSDFNGCPIEKFVVGDVNTVLLVARALAHNNVVAFEAKCPECGHAHRSQIAVPDELVRVGEKTDDYPGYDTITLPECQDVVKIRPLLVGDVIAIEQRDQKLRAKYPDVLCRMLVPVVDVNETTPDTFDELVTWYHALTPSDSRFLVSSQDDLYPHLNTDLEWKCDQCNADFEFPLLFNEKFFRADGPRKPGGLLAPASPPGV